MGRYILINITELRYLTNCHCDSGTTDQVCSVVCWCMCMHTDSWLQPQFAALLVGENLVAVHNIW